MNTRIFFVFPTLVVATLALEGKARAICDDTETETSQADTDMNQVFPCGESRTNNTQIMRNDFDMTDGDWAGRGTANLCNFNTELAKHINAGALLTIGVDFTRGPNAVVQSFHSTGFPDGDYSNLTAAAETNDWHDDFKHQAIDPNPSFVAQYLQNTFSLDQLQFSCPLYDTGKNFGRVGEADPAFRAAIIVHEAWHAWENENGGGFNNSCGHQVCPPPMGTTRATVGSCGGNSECDTWTPHPLGGEGSMNDLQHRPYPSSVEFGCDIGNTPAEFVPTTVRELAMADADVFGTTDIVNGPMPACLGFNFGVHYATCTAPGGTQCDQALPCADPTQVCNPGSGCCETPPSTIHPFVTISALQTQTGPNICAAVSGFIPGEQVNITYDGVPDLPASLDRGTFTTDGTGSFPFVDTTFDQTLEFCGNNEQFTKTTVVVTGITSGRTATDTIENGFFCGTTPVGVGIGSLCPP